MAPYLAAVFAILTVVLGGCGALDALTRNPPAPSRIPTYLAVAAGFASLVTSFIAIVLTVVAVRQENRRASRRLRRPWAIAATSSGAVYVLDMGHDQVIRVTDNDFEPLSFSESVFWGDMASPRDLAIDGLDRVLVADTGGKRIVRFEASMASVLYADGSFYPTYRDPPQVAPLAIGQPSGLYVSSAGTIGVSDLEGKRILMVGIEGEIRVLATLADFASGPVSPRSLRQAPDGRLLVVDRLGNRVLEVGSGIRIFAGTGLPGYSGDGGPAPECQLRQPDGLAVTPDGAVFIADTGNDVIRRVARDGTITTVAGNGQHGYSGDGDRATSASLAGPRGLCTAPWGGLLLADAENARVRWLAPDGRIETIIGPGTAPWPVARSDGGSGSPPSGR